MRREGVLLDSVTDHAVGPGMHTTLEDPRKDKFTIMDLTAVRKSSCHC